MSASSSVPLTTLAFRAGLAQSFHVPIDSSLSPAPVAEASPSGSASAEAQSDTGLVRRVCRAVVRALTRTPPPPQAEEDPAMPRVESAPEALRGDSPSSEEAGGSSRSAQASDRLPAERLHPIAMQARLYLPVAEMIAREVAYAPLASFEQEWQVQGPAFHEGDLNHWQRMFDDTRHWVVLGASQEGADPTARVRVAGYRESRSHCERRTPGTQQADADGTPGAHAEGDDSFRMVWGSVDLDQLWASPSSQKEVGRFVAFRGTANGDGWAADLTTTTEKGFEPGEARFRALAAQHPLVRDTLTELLADLPVGKKARLLITGHSLGASDCERFAVLVAQHVAALPPADQQRIAGITVIPFNSPGTNEAWGKSLNQAAQVLSSAGVEIACIDMKQHKDAVQIAASSRISVQMPDHSVIIKMGNAPLQRLRPLSNIAIAHTTRMTIARQAERCFQVCRQEMNGELSDLKSARDAQLSSTTRRWHQVGNWCKGAVKRLAARIWSRSGQLQSPAALTAESVQQAVVECMRHVASQVDPVAEFQDLQVRVAQRVQALLRARAGNCEGIPDLDDIIFGISGANSQFREELRPLCGPEPLPRLLQYALDGRLESAEANDLRAMLDEDLQEQEEAVNPLWSLAALFDDVPVMSSVASCAVEHREEPADGQDSPESISAGAPSASVLGAAVSFDEAGEGSAVGPASPRASVVSVLPPAIFEAEAPVPAVHAPVWQPDPLEALEGLADLFSSAAPLSPPALDLGAAEPIEEAGEAPAAGAVSPRVPASPAAPVSPRVPASPAAPVSPRVPASPAAPVSPRVPASPAAPVSPRVPVSPRASRAPHLFRRLLNGCVALFRSVGTWILRLWNGCRALWAR